MELQKQVYKEKSEQNILFRMVAYLPSKIFEGMARLRSALYQRNFLPSRKLPGKCISIGNISLGGTGKTPLVIEIAKFLELHKKQVLILTRGYKSGLADGEFVVFNNGRICAGNRKSGHVYADEAMLQSKKLPNAYIVVGAKRFEATQQFLSEYDLNLDKLVFILDDGYQHQKIYRDLNILLVDSSTPLGNGEVLPLGPLREPVDAVSRCDMLVWTRANLVVKRGYGSQLIEGLTEGKVSIKADFVEGKIFEVSKEGLLNEVLANDLGKINLLAVTAIAHPNRFFDSVRKVGLQAKDELCFLDHQRFDLDLLTVKFSHCDALITTAKDYWRDPKLFEGLPISVFILDLKIEISDAKFEKALLDLITL